MQTKLVTKTVRYISFSSKIVCNHLYLVIILLFIWNHIELLNH